MRYLKNGIMTESTKSMEGAILRFDAKNEIEELKKALSDSDYAAIKYAEGALSEEDFAKTRAERAKWRERINTLEEFLGQK